MGLILQQFRQMEEIDDACLEVNQLKEEVAWDAESQFDKAKDKSKFRQYETACDRVKNFYAEQHAKQTVAYNLQARVNFNTKSRMQMTIWEAMEKLNEFIDESDPDTELSQIEHALQTAETIRKDNKPRWFQLTGLIHDLGKILLMWDVPSWSVVGDTFPVGCAFDLEKNIYPDTFKKNPDYNHPIYSTELGIYHEGCGLDHVLFSYGHDEYLYNVLKNQSKLPPGALAIIRYHSCYPIHREDAYSKLMTDHDKEMIQYVKMFRHYDLYSKDSEPMDLPKLKAYYQELIDEYIPGKINF